MGSCRIITVANARGGCGKSFISTHVPFLLAEKGYRCLVVDTDPQGTVGLWYGIQNDITLQNLLLGEVSLDEVAVPYKDRLDVILSKESIKAAEMQLVGATGREKVLEIKFRDFGVMDRYDFVFIDTSPSLSLLNQNAYLASSEVIIPINMEPFALVGASSIIETLKLIRGIFKHRVSLLGVVPTFVLKSSNIAKTVHEKILSTYESVLPPIRNSVKIKESCSERKTLFEYDPKAPVIEDLHTLAESVVTGGKSNG